MNKQSLSSLGFKSVSVNEQQGFIGELVLILFGFAVIAVGAFLYFGQSNASDDDEAAVQTVTLPRDAVKVSACLPFQGEHWVALDDIPNGPYYTYYEGKVLGLEYMVDPADIPGEEFAKLPPDQVNAYIAEHGPTFSDVLSTLHLSFDLFDFPINHTEISWTPPHAAFASPHYDMHYYLVSKEELATVCPDAKLEDNFAPELIEDLQQLNVPLPGPKDAPAE